VILVPEPEGAADDRARAITGLARRDGRFRPEAFHFVLLSLNRLLASLETPRHVSARELLEAIRAHAASEYGRMARLVFEDWGVRTTRDFGEIVYLLIGEGILAADRDDRPEDFDGVFDFSTAFDGEPPPRD
jgi:uncharacterized repeat protein (TIGR04138 family)